MKTKHPPHQESKSSVSKIVYIAIASILLLAVVGATQFSDLGIFTSSERFIIGGGPSVTINQSSALIVPGNATLNSSIIIIRKNGKVEYYPSANTDTARGAVLNSTVPTIVAGDSIVLGSGNFDIGDNCLNFSNRQGISFKGQGIRVSTITSTCSLQPTNHGSIISPSNNSYWADFGIIGDDVGGTNYQSLFGLNGFGNIYQEYPSTNVTVARVLFKGDSDGIYYHGGNESATRKISLDCYDCVFEQQYDSVRMLNMNETSRIRLFNPSITIQGPSPLGGSGVRAIGVKTGTVQIYGGSITALDGGAGLQTFALYTDGALGNIEAYGGLSLNTSNVGDVSLDINAQLGRISLGPGVVYNPSLLNGTIRFVGSIDNSQINIQNGTAPSTTSINVTALQNRSIVGNETMLLGRPTLWANVTFGGVVYRTPLYKL